MNALALACPHCGAVVAVPAADRTATCLYCATPGMVERPAAEERAQLVIPFSIGEATAISSVQRWLGTRGFFAPRGLRAAVLEKPRGVYLPVGLFSALQHSTWEASICENRGTDSPDLWWPLSGEHSSWVTDIVVTASKGLSNEELQRIEPFRLDELRRLTPEALAGWAAEEPSRSDEEVLSLGREEALRMVYAKLVRFMPGDGHRDLKSSTEWAHETNDRALMPVWVLVAGYDAQRPLLRVLVNGQTGAVGGDPVPSSGLKIALVVLLCLAVVAGVAVASVVIWGGFAP